VLDSRIKHGVRRVDAVAGVQQPDDVLIDLEEVAPVGVVGVGRRESRQSAWPYDSR
jgi:hypothetical protein